MLVQGAQMTKTFRVENFHCGLKSLQVALKVSTVAWKNFPGCLESFHCGQESFQEGGPNFVKNGDPILSDMGT